MVEIKGVDVSDVIGIGKSVEKIAEFVKAGIGTAYKPIGMMLEGKAEASNIKRRADANAYELDTIANGCRKNIDMPVAYDNGAISISTESPQDLLERAKARFCYQLTTEQRNIESIIEGAKQELQDTPEVPDVPVDQRWAMRFFECAAEISDEETQELWAKVLAGETKKKGSFSLRTIEVIKNLSKEEAELFTWATQYICLGTGTSFMIIDQKLEDEFQIDYGKLITLDDCGLFSSYAKQFRFSSIDGDHAFATNDFIFILKYHSKDASSSIRVYNLTSSGYELLSLISCNSNINYMKKLMRSINKSNSMVTISMYEKKKDLNWTDYINEKNLLEED